MGITGRRKSSNGSSAAARQEWRRFVKFMAWSRPLWVGICLVGGSASAFAQDLDRNKTPGQLFSSNCTACHRSAQGLAKNLGASGLPSFLRQHYTTGPAMAASLAGFLVAAGDAPPSRAGRAAAPNPPTRRQRRGAVRTKRRSSGGPAKPRPPRMPLPPPRRHRRVSVNPASRRQCQPTPNRSRSRSHPCRCLKTRIRARAGWRRRRSRPTWCCRRRRLYAPTTPYRLPPQAQPFQHRLRPVPRRLSRAQRAPPRFLLRPAHPLRERPIEARPCPRRRPLPPRCRRAPTPRRRRSRISLALLPRYPEPLQLRSLPRPQRAPRRTPPLLLPAPRARLCLRGEP